MNPTVCPILNQDLTLFLFVMSNDSNFDFTLTYIYNYESVLDDCLLYLFFLDETKKTKLSGIFSSIWLFLDV